MTINGLRKHRVTWTVVIAAFGVSTGITHADVVYVDHAAAPGGSGGSWAEAFSDLSDAISAAAPGDELWVAAGAYGNVSLAGGIRLYGGFTGEEVERDERDWVANETIVDRVLVYHPEPGVIDGFTTDHVTVIDAAAELWNCRIAPTETHELGAGIHAEGGSLLLDGCTVTDGEAEIGGGMYARGLSSIRLVDSTFIGNRAALGVGGVGIFQTGEIEIIGCSFIDNDGGEHSGGLAAGDGPAVMNVINTQFIGNRASFVAAGCGTSHATNFVNCVFSRNTAQIGAGFVVAGAKASLTNCSFSDNLGDAICVNFGATVSVTNSVLWGNVPSAFAGYVEGLTVSYSDVEFGWSGVGNIDADPLFVQPGTDDLRLGLGSPCLDAGDNSAVPPGIETDLAGAPRIQGGTVDMGAYEGAFEPLPPSAVVHDFDTDDVEFLVPDGVGYDPVSYATVVARNVTGPDDATMSVTQFGSAVHPDAAGFSEISHILALETSLTDGTFFATVSIPFSAGDLDGADPSDVDVTGFDDGTGNWTLAATANTVDSPGHPRRFGDRIAVVGDGASGFGISSEVGDFGVFWNPALERGFAWATVDHAGDFGVGAPYCPADTRQPPNGLIGFEDLTGVIGAWGAGAGPYDANGDGVVDTIDLVEVLAQWGGCVP